MAVVPSSSSLRQTRDPARDAGHARRTFDEASVGRTMIELIERLFPICRSITGNGARSTLAALQDYISLSLDDVPSGKRVFDWFVPKEWNIRDAFVKDSSGRRVIDFQKSNLHVVNYSLPVQATMTLEELRPRLFSIPEQPDWIPYRTSYYQEDWGFCLSHNELQKLSPGNYEVCIDSTLADGSLTWGEAYFAGDVCEEVLISTHICHPSLANDNLSGVAVSTMLAAWIGSLPKRHYSYRFVYLPGTIGAITWLWMHRDLLPRIQHGLVLAVVGDDGPTTYKQSRRGNAEIDRAFQSILSHSGAPYTIKPFAPTGYDERQYCSPGIDLAMGCLQRTPPGQYPEYHTSADNLSLVREESLVDSWSKAARALQVLEGNRTYTNTNPHCEPQLGRRGLYRATGGRVEQAQLEQAMLWVLNYSDHKHSLLDISELAGFSFPLIREAADLLVEHGLLTEKETP